MHDLPTRVLAASLQKRSLVVDDVPEVRDLVIGILAELGYEVVSACDGERALQIIEHDGLGQALHNDLQPAATGLRPGLQRCLDGAAELGALGAVVSGSGPTVAVLAEDDEHATALGTALVGDGLARSFRVADGPVHGARVVRTG